MTRLERQQQAGGYGENLPTRGSMASFASFPSLISVDNMSENFDQSSLGMQSPWPSTNNLAQNESFNGLPKMGQSESNLAAMDTQPTSTASTAEKNRSASGGMTSWPSLTALVGAYEEDPSTNQRYAASAPGPANKSSNENAATPSVEAPVRQDEGSAANARQTQQQEEELQSAPQAQLVKTEEVTAAAGTGDGGDAVPESSSPAAPPPAQAPSDSASPPPSSPSPRVAAEATAKEEPVADVKRSPPPKPKEEERRPVPSLSRKLQSHQGSIRRQHRNSSVENFFSLVQSGDIPAPDDDLLSLPILQHISSDNPHPRQHQQPQQQQQQQKRSAGEAFNNQQDPKRSTKHAYTASRT